MSTPTATSAKDRILQAARELFYEEGIRAVGIDRIIERSGVAKMTLYRHFPSKDDLIVAYLNDLNRCHEAWFEGAIATHAGAPARQLLGVFEALVAKMSVPDCRGCAFSNVVTEFPEAGHPGRQVAIAHATAVRERLTGLARDAGAAEPEELGDQLALLLDGANTLGQKMEGRLAAMRARDIARLLIGTAIPRAGD